MTDASYKAPGVLMMHLILQSGIATSAGLLWKFTMYIQGATTAFFIANYLFNPLRARTDIPLMSGLTYLVFSFILYCYVARVMDLAARGTFILTKRLKDESIDLMVKVDNLNLFNSINEAKGNVVLDTVIEATDIQKLDVLGEKTAQTCINAEATWSLLN